MRSQSFLIQYRTLQITRLRDHKLWSWFFDPHRKINENDNPKISGSQTKTIQKFKIKDFFHWKWRSVLLNLDRMRIILSYPKKHGRIKNHRGIIFFVPFRITGSYKFAHKIKKKQSSDHRIMENVRIKFTGSWISLRSNSWIKSFFWSS